MDGESGGQILILDADMAGDLDGMVRRTYGGDAQPLDANEVRTAEITTRDVDRGGFPHYLLKEISQAAHSVQ
jgi:glucosamine--fructose-6-phosphate aminotransferase (isomerizing)